MTDKQAIADMQNKINERNFNYKELKKIFDEMAAELGVLPEPVPEPVPEPEPEPEPEAAPEPEAKNGGASFFGS